MLKEWNGKKICTELSVIVQEAPLTAQEVYRVKMRYHLKVYDSKVKVSIPFRQKALGKYHVFCRYGDIELHNYGDKYVYK